MHIHIHTYIYSHTLDAAPKPPAPGESASFCSGEMIHMPVIYM